MNVSFISVCPTFKHDMIPTSTIKQNVRIEFDLNYFRRNAIWNKHSQQLVNLDYLQIMFANKNGPTYSLPEHITEDSLSNKTVSRKIDGRNFQENTNYTIYLRFFSTEKVPHQERLIYYNCSSSDVDVNYADLDTSFWYCPNNMTRRIKLNKVCDGEDDCGDLADESPILCRPKGYSIHHVIIGCLVIFLVLGGVAYGFTEKYYFKSNNDSKSNPSEETPTLLPLVRTLLNICYNSNNY